MPIRENFGAGNGNRTRIICLGSTRSTIELYPHGWHDNITIFELINLKNKTPHHKTGRFVFINQLFCRQGIFQIIEAAFGIINSFLLFGFFSSAFFLLGFKFLFNLCLFSFIFSFLGF